MMVVSFRERKGAHNLERKDIELETEERRGLGKGGKYEKDKNMLPKLLKLGFSIHS
jgi:hypothetical protein